MASGVTTMFWPENSDELCNRLKKLLQEKQAGISSKIINDEVIALAEKLLEFKCITTEQHKQILVNCNLIHDNV